jgi:hypothetical protein
MRFRLGRLDVAVDDMDRSLGAMLALRILFRAPLFGYAPFRPSSSFDPHPRLFDFADATSRTGT